MKISDYVGTRPVLVPESFLNGELEGWGVMESAFGNVQKRYTIKAQGVLKGKVLFFTETWTFDDGFVDTLSWEISPTASNTYCGREKKLVGEEAHGETSGCAFHWQYKRNTPRPNGKSVVLSFDDWFFQVDERTVIVKGAASKFGLTFAKAYVTYRKL